MSHSKIFVVKTSQDLAQIMEHGRCSVCGHLATGSQISSLPHGLGYTFFACCPDHAVVIETLVQELGGEI